MSISRRNLIVGAGASTVCAITPSFAERVLNHVERHGQPLFEGAKAADKVLQAFNTGDFYQIIDPLAADEFHEPLPLTWRQVINLNGYEPTEDVLENYCITVEELDQKADGGTIWHLWEISTSPFARAFKLLEPYQYDFAHELYDEGGELSLIKFIEGGRPGDSSRWVDVSSDEALSCLQYSLTKLDAGIRIEIAPEGLY